MLRTACYFATSLFLARICFHTARSRARGVTPAERVRHPLTTTKTKLKYSSYVGIVLLGIFICAKTTRAQDATTWIPRSVGSPTSEVKAAGGKAKNVGSSSSFRLRSRQPNVNSESPEQPNAAQSEITLVTTMKTQKAVEGPTIASGPTTQDLILYPCCDCNRILPDAFMLYPNATLQLFNSIHNTVVTVTLGHAGPGRIGFALNFDGPYTDTLAFDITTDGSGNGSRVIAFFIKGLEVGQSDMTTSVSSGFTNLVPRMEVFACQCPPVTPLP
jgi:hypothetical protein